MQPLYDFDMSYITVDKPCELGKVPYIRAAKHCESTTVNEFSHVSFNCQNISSIDITMIKVASE